MYYFVPPTKSLIKEKLLRSNFPVPAISNSLAHTHSIFIAIFRSPLEYNYTMFKCIVATSCWLMWPLCLLNFCAHAVQVLSQCSQCMHLLQFTIFAYAIKVSILPQKTWREQNNIMRNRRRKRERERKVQKLFQFPYILSGLASPGFFVEATPSKNNS